MAKVIWTDTTTQDLNDIGEYIAKDSQKYAEITEEQHMLLPKVQLLLIISTIR